jgi:hypothetical protein
MAAPRLAIAGPRNLFGTDLSGDKSNKAFERYIDEARQSARRPMR